MAIFGEKVLFHPQSNILELKLELYTIKKLPTKTVDKYVSRIKEIIDKLAVVSLHFDEEEILIHILNGLSTDFNAFHTSIRMRNNNSLLRILFY